MYTSEFIREAEPFPNENIVAMTQMRAARTNRKRSRTTEQDGSDFMPISKRINQLHIRSSNAANSDADDENEDSLLQISCVNMGECSSGTSEDNGSPEMRDFHNPPTPLQSSAPDHGPHQHYDPDLNEQENPFYFHINSMLFELHLQRITRHSMNLHADRPTL